MLQRRVKLKMTQMTVLRSAARVERLMPWTVQPVNLS